jgi:hypothetical protein
LKLQRHLSQSLEILHPRFLGIFLIFTILSVGNSAASSGQHTDVNKIIGEWTRLDGSYAISINDILPDGTANAAYFNPSPIKVSEAGVSLWKGLVKLFIKLQDEGYPGSTYTLFYHAEKDALAGFYYQAEIRQIFEVVFLRKKTD